MAARPPARIDRAVLVDRSPDRVRLVAAAHTLAQADPFGDADRLSEGVCVPGGAGTGVKWMFATANVELPAGAATASTYTSPVNQSGGAVRW